MKVSNDLITVFDQIYKNDLWHGGSGIGSRADYNIEYSECLIKFIKNNCIKTVLDYGCGDWQFSQFIPWSDIVEKYIGVDVVNDVITVNRMKYTHETIHFELVNSEWRWPIVDLIICKDVLQHLPDNIVSELLNKMKLYSKYLLITNDVNGCNVNIDCEIGQYRPLDLTKYPWEIKATVIGNFYYVNTYHKQTILVNTNIQF